MSAYALWRIAFHVLTCYAKDSFVSFVLYLPNVWRSYGFLFLLPIDTKVQLQGISCIIIVTTRDRLINVNENWGISC
jgi:hypothetical protein